MKRPSVRLAVLLLGVTASVAVAAKVHVNNSPSHQTFMDKVLF